MGERLIGGVPRQSDNLAAVPLGPNANVSPSVTDSWEGADL